MNEARHRVFFALWPDAAAASHLASLAGALTAHGGRLIKPSALHLTLEFIGEVSDVELMRLTEAASEVRGARFELALDRLGYWPRGGILWAGCRQVPAELRELGGALRAALSRADLSRGDRHPGDFAPHVTLARRARCASLPRLDTPIGWHVDRFALVESRLHPSAASYRVLAEFPLAAAAP